MAAFKIRAWGGRGDVKLTALKSQSPREFFITHAKPLSEES